MSGILMMVIAIVVLGGAYLLYGRYLQNKWGIDPNAKTPAYEMEDGVDYVPADTNVVFGHQFASIAGAGPINGTCPTGDEHRRHHGEARSRLHDRHGDALRRHVLM